MLDGAIKEVTLEEREATIGDLRRRAAVVTSAGAGGGGSKGGNQCKSKARRCRLYLRGAELRDDSAPLPTIEPGETVACVVRGEAKKRRRGKMTLQVELVATATRPLRSRRRISNSARRSGRMTTHP